MELTSGEHCIAFLTPRTDNQESVIRLFSISSPSAKTARVMKNDDSPCRPVAQRTNLPFPSEKTLLQPQPVPDDNHNIQHTSSIHPTSIRQRPQHIDENARNHRHKSFTLKVDRWRTDRRQASSRQHHPPPSGPLTHPSSCRTHDAQLLKYPYMPKSPDWTNHSAQRKAADAACCCRFTCTSSDHTMLRPPTAGGFPVARQGEPERLAAGAQHLIPGREPQQLHRQSPKPLVDLSLHGRFKLTSLSRDGLQTPDGLLLLLLLLC